MKSNYPIFIIICFITSFVAKGADLSIAGSDVSASQSLSPELKALQGTWKGLEIIDQSEQEIRIKITGNKFHFFRDKDFWFETTIELPSGTEPKQLHATIKDCPEPQKDSIGKVVGAIYKIENGTLTLYSYDIDSEVPKSFDGPTNRYVVKKILNSTKQPPASEAGPSQLSPFPLEKVQQSRK